MKKIFKYGTGDEIPEGAIYLYTIKNGTMSPLNKDSPSYVWHYFLVEVEE